MYPIVIIITIIFYNRSFFHILVKETSVIIIIFIIFYDRSFFHRPVKETSIIIINTSIEVSFTDL